jgi:hypothetical protein
VKDAEGYGKKEGGGKYGFHQSILQGVAKKLGQEHPRKRGELRNAIFDFCLAPCSNESAQGRGRKGAKTSVFGLEKRIRELKVDETEAGQ